MDARELWNAVKAMVEERGGRWRMASVNEDVIRSPISGDDAIEFLSSDEFRQWLLDNAPEWMRARTELIPTTVAGKPSIEMRFTLEHHEGRKANPWEIGEDQIYFHVTLASLVPKILKEGLKPKPSSRPDMHDYLPRIYLAPSVSTVEKVVKGFRKYAEQRGDERPDLAILAVDILPFIGDLRVDHELKGAFWLSRPIPPEFIAEIDVGARTVSPVNEQVVVEIDEIS